MKQDRENGFPGKYTFSSLIIIGSVIIVLIITIMGIVYFQNKLHATGLSKDNLYSSYDKHYAFITDNVDQDFWNEVYSGAFDKGKSQNIYVERFGKYLFEDYNKNEILRMAINGGVDGIIFEGDADPETEELINSAVNKGIPVITVLKDSSRSLRQCYVGINSYNLGQEYGKQLLKMKDKDIKRVFVLVDEKNEDSSKNIILLAIRETIEKELGKDHGLDIEAVVVDNENAFSSEEAIRDIIMDSENVPDVMICMNATYTQCAYQSVVDHNKVGEINILGYYDSDNILNAIKKGIIYSTISVDTKQMGNLCVTALEEFELTGHVSEYLPVDTKMITPDNVKEYIREE
ncbi:monosaccharide ABC transporter substrate-binding protein (CUT2 family) [Mobilisporobacter senegalensis]|uniref:Monosaccharide ABC transporter substrate-binding protein (CUT2 family) n=1 Tax=Mobilisporobacter senegalensis TaxID=1329262 RepID=A0A3N1XUS2_9FIRM|nr:substrate-binding domain-containing protein [Mobilisporobacter senegalensis]ROR30369.1 monosaccharide ABC transporter substrate-binding protein (CUT2 family) [Mobilisporobacter senegalensis]